MNDKPFYVVTTINNPIRWESRPTQAIKAITSWLQEPAVIVYIVRVTYGARPYDDLGPLENHPRVVHINVKASTLAWSKENCLNIGISRLPHDAEFVGTFDADIIWRKPGWANEIKHALQLYPVVQPWKTCYDLGPNDDHIQTHRSFASLYHEGKPVTPNNKKFWKHDGGPYEYAHSGFAWAYTMQILNLMGGLFEHGGMGSGDHHMALGLVGLQEKSMPEGTDPMYQMMVNVWSARAKLHVNGKIGYIPSTIEHLFHGSKTKRKYVGRWDMFVNHKFNPLTDLKKNVHGVIEFSGNKPELEREFTNYFESRNEDANTLD